MQQDLTTEQRLARLERQVAELERDRRMQEARDLALLARIDGFIDDLRRVERVQLKAFDTLEAQLQEHNARLGRVENNIAVLAETAVQHKASIETIAKDQSTMATDMHTMAEVQQQILVLLNGPKRND